MEYNFRDIEQKWQKRWVENGTYRVVEDEKKKKYYVLNMFPYPSGAGLHVGHPLGYILRCLRTACRAVRHPDRTAPRKDH